MLLDVARWIQSTALSEALAGAIWAYPLISALHLLGLAWFGGAVLLAALRGRDPEARPSPVMLWAGAVMMIVTGALLVAIEPHRCATSQSFRVKLLLLAVLVATIPLRPKLGNRWGAAVTLALWAAVVLAARGIAFV
jgi:hypothetical protein